MAAQFTEMNGFLRARGLAVNVPGQDFLAGARFAGDQDAGVRLGDLVGELDHMSHRLVAIESGHGNPTSPPPERRR